MTRNRYAKKKEIQQEAASFCGQVCTHQDILIGLCGQNIKVQAGERTQGRYCGL